MFGLIGRADRGSSCSGHSDPLLHLRRTHRYQRDAAACSELLPGLGRQCFYDGDILQQFLRQTVPLL
jgi:hypothetical protein